MIESFVDLTYRGLPLGRRVKLTQVRPSTGYLEFPAPMPVGTAIAIATDEGIVLDAIVTAIHEQVGGSDRTPGMTMSPTLADDAARSWWRARVALPEEELAAPRNRPLTVRPRSHTIPQPPPPAALVVPAFEAEPEPPGRKTRVMEAVGQDEIAEEIEPSVPDAGEHAVIDDGKRTSAMAAVDLGALGLEVAPDESPAAPDDDGSPGDDDKPSSGLVKKRKKKR